MNNQKLRRFIPLFLTVALFLSVFSFGATANAASVTGTDIANYAKTLIGKPYKSGANGPSSFDNWGLTQYIYKHYGLNLGSSVTAQSKQGKLIRKGYAVKPGDLLFFSYYSSKVNMVAIYLGNDQMAAVTHLNKKVKVYNTEDFRKHYEGARRLTSYVKAPTNVDPKPTNPATSERDQLAAKVVQASKKYLGVKYKLGGDYDLDGTFAFDCSGFTRRVFSDVGIKLPRTATQQYKATADNRIPDSDLKVGDLVFFDLNLNTGIDHIGIYLGNGDFIHASTAKDGGVQISNMETMSYWKKRYLYATRVF